MIDKKQIEADARLLELQRQRNNALNELVLKAGELAKALNELEELKKLVEGKTNGSD